MKQFEYRKTVKSQFNIDFLNEKGRQGWELVQILQLSTGGFTLYFKREIIKQNEN